MKLKIFLFILYSFFLIGCDKKTPPQINMTKFLPMGNITKYTYKSTEKGPYSDGTDILIQEKVITNREKNCVKIENYTLSKKKRLKSLSETFCTDKNKIEISQSLSIQQEKHTWKIQMLRFTKNCEFASLTKENIFNKERDVIHLECKYTLLAGRIDMLAKWFIAEDIGLYKLIQISDWKDPKSMSVDTMELIKYE